MIASFIQQAGCIICAMWYTDKHQVKKKKKEKSRHIPSKGGLMVVPALL